MKGTIRRHVDVLHALIIRDIQTRFGGRHINFLLALAWPLAHIGFLLVTYGFLGRTSPIGSSATMFFATGLTPYMFFNYPSRFMTVSVLSNRPLLSFPVVKLMDVIIARAILETVAGCAVICVTAFALWCFDEHVWPSDPGLALVALGAMWSLAIGWGVSGAVIATVLPMWAIISALLQIVFYITSGILFVASQMPTPAQQILTWNPLTQGVELFRSAYYSGLQTEYFPATVYPYAVGFSFLLAALVFERFFVRKKMD